MVHGERKLAGAGQRTSFFGQRAQALEIVGKYQCAGVLHSRAAADTAVEQSV